MISKIYSYLKRKERKNNGNQTCFIFSQVYLHFFLLFQQKIGLFPFSTTEKNEIRMYLFNDECIRQFLV